MQVTLTNQAQLHKAVAVIDTARFTVRGHKLRTSWSGANSSYANGFCECGWICPRWTTSMTQVRDSHQTHLSTVINAAARSIATVQPTTALAA